MIFGVVYVENYFNKNNYRKKWFEIYFSPIYSTKSQRL